jgi:hypothetical protein
MSAEHPTDTAAYLDELDAFRRRVVAEAEALPPIRPTVELTEAETDQLCNLLARVRGALRCSDEQADENPYDQALKAALNDLTERTHHARDQAHQATIDRDRAYIQDAYQQRLPRRLPSPHDHAQQRDSQQGGGVHER